VFLHRLEDDIFNPADFTSSIAMPSAAASEVVAPLSSRIKQSNEIASVAHFSSSDSA